MISIDALRNTQKASDVLLSACGKEQKGENMSWLILTLSCILLWGITDILLKKSLDYSDSLSQYKTFIWIGLVAALSGAVAAFCSDTLPDSIRMLADNLFLIPVTVFYVVAMFFGLLGAKHLDASVVSPLENIDGAITAIILYIFFFFTGRSHVTDSIGIVDIVGTVTITVGVILLGIQEQKLSKQEKNHDEDKKKHCLGALALLFPIAYNLVDAHLHFGKWHDIEVEDDVSAYVEYANGATGVFITTTGDAHGSNRFEIQMDGAKFVVENDKLTMEEYEMSEPEFSKTNEQPFGTVNSKHIEVETDGENPQHIGVLNAWADAILHGGKLVAEGAEGINGLTLSNAMHLSAFLDKEIELPFDEELYYNELMKRVATSRRKENVKAVFADTSNTYRGSK